MPRTPSRRLTGHRPMRRQREERGAGGGGGSWLPRRTASAVVPCRRTPPRPCSCRQPPVPMEAEPSRGPEVIGTEKFPQDLNRVPRRRGRRVAGGGGGGGWTRTACRVAGGRESVRTVITAETRRHAGANGPGPVSLCRGGIRLRAPSGKLLRGDDHFRRPAGAWVCHRGEVDVPVGPSGGTQSVGGPETNRVLCPFRKAGEMFYSGTVAPLSRCARVPLPALGPPPVPAPGTPHAKPSPRQ